MHKKYTEELAFVVSGVLAKLYCEVLDVLVRDVRNNGHLVISLPNSSHTGRPLPFCTSSQIVISQVLVVDEKGNGEIYMPARSSLRMLLPPYYWESGTLRRTVLHFRIRDKQ